LHRITWYTSTCGRTYMCLLYRLNPMVTNVTFMLWWALDPMFVFVTGSPFMNEGHGYGFASSVGHLMSSSTGLLIYDGMHTYPGNRCCITGYSKHRQPTFMVSELVMSLKAYYITNFVMIYLISFVVIFLSSLNISMFTVY